MEGSASPRNPKETILKRSCLSVILLVACLVKASGTSTGSIPAPLSTTRINVSPAFSTTMSICVAPASIAFSTNSFTTLAGRSMTSPAAIWLANKFDSSCILPITILRRDASLLTSHFFQTVKCIYRIHWRHVQNIIIV